MSGYQSNLNVQTTIINDSPGGFALTGGAANQYTVTLENPATVYDAGLDMQLMFHTANTGATTINVDGLGAVSLKKVVDGVAADLEAGDLNTLEIYDVVYNGLFFQIEVPTDPASYEQVRAGVNNKRFITPYLLLTFLNSLAASDTARGLIGLANQTEVDTGTDNSKAITPLKLATHLNSLVASESFKGLAEIATQTEVDTGTDDSKIVTALKLANLLNSLVASESFAGLIELASHADALAGVDDSKAITSLKLATVLNNLSAGEGSGGLVEIATLTEVDTGTNDTKAITPLKLNNHLAGLTASEQYQGLASIASQTEVNTGTDDTKFITPAKLDTLLGNLVASESFKGLIEIASDSDVLAGVDDAKAVTSKKLATALNDRAASQAEVTTGTASDVFVTPLTLKGYSDGGEPGLGNPTIDGMVLSSDATGSRTWKETNHFLFNHLGTVNEGSNPGTGEAEITPSYVIPAGELSNNEGLRIIINGEIAQTYGGTTLTTNKTLRIYIGNEVVLFNDNEPSPYGQFQVEIMVHRFDGTTLVGWGRLNVNDLTPDVQMIRTNLTNSMDSNNTTIKITAQNPLGGQGFSGSLFTRYSFSVEKLIAPDTAAGSTLADPDNGTPILNPNPGGGNGGGDEIIDPDPGGGGNNDEPGFQNVV